MEEQAANPDPFMEPVYLNEKMVLNCAAYIFKGYSLESEINDTTQTERRRGGKAGFNFLERLVSIGLEAGSNPDYSWRPRLGPWEATPEPDSVADSGK